MRHFKPIITPSLLLILSACRLSGPDAVPQPRIHFDPSECSVRFHAVTRAGGVIPFRVVTFQSAEKPSSPNLASSFHNMKAPRVECGRYSYRLEPLQPKDYYPIAGNLLLWNGARHWETVIAEQRNPVQADDSPPVPNVSLRVVGVSKYTGPLRIRLTSILTDEMEETEVDPDGRFFLSRNHFGRFTLAVIDGADRVLHVRAIEIRTRVQEPLTIDLTQ